MLRFPLPLLALPILVGIVASPQEPQTEPTVQPKHEMNSPEEVLTSAIQAIGGRREIQAMESFQLHGTIRLLDGRPLVEIDLSTSLGGKVLGVMTFVDIGQSRFGSDGETAWEQNFNTDQTPMWSLIDQAALSQKVRQINWIEWFTMLPSRLDDMQFKGSTVFDGEECWEILIQGEDVKKQSAFFSCTTHRPRGRRTIEVTREGDATVNVYFREWKRVENLLLFHSVVFDRDGAQVIMKLDRIEIDTVQDEIFTLPEQIRQLKEQS